MARTSEEIKREMTDNFMSDSTLQQSYGFDKDKSFADNFSKVSIENLLFGIVASAINTFEKLFDIHLQEVNDTMAKRAHTLTWYRNKALEFRFGYTLRDDVAEYDENISESDLRKANIIKKCSCQTADASFPTILVKVAKDSEPLTDTELTQFSAYMNEIADAGVRIVTRSLAPDKLALKLKVWYDPLLCDKDGYLYLGSNGKTVAESAIEEYLSDLAFNGAFYPKLLEQYMMKKDAIKMAKVISAKGSPQVEGEPETIDDMYLPYAGAMVYDKDAVGYGIEFLNFEDTYRNA